MVFVAEMIVPSQVIDDFDRIFDHMSQFNVEGAPERIGEIVQAVQILSHSPLIGRPVKRMASSRFSAPNAMLSSVSTGC